MVEGRALPEDFHRDVMGEMRRIMDVLQPRVDALSGDIDNAQVDDVLREASAAFREAHAATYGTSEPVERQQPSQEAIEILARVLSGTQNCKVSCGEFVTPRGFLRIGSRWKRRVLYMPRISIQRKLPALTRIEGRTCERRRLAQRIPRGRFLTDVTHVSHFCHAEASAMSAVGL